MEIISNLSSYISELYSSVSPAVNGSTVNLKNIEQRENIITELTGIRESVNGLLGRLADYVQKMQDAQTKEIDDMYQLINKIKACKDVKPARPIGGAAAVPDTDNSAEGAWTKVVRSRKSQSRPTLLAPRPNTNNITNGINNSASPNVSVNMSNGANTGVSTGAGAPVNYSHVKFTEALALPAIRVASFDFVKQNGELYYVECTDHFAFRLSGKLFHGNIGNIYTDEKAPTKIKNCKFANQCIKRDKCDYYHDPLRFAGSTDRRNFIASSWLYSPPNSQFKNKFCSRRFGSREHLDMDIMDVQDEETSRFYDQTMHDILCSMLLKHYNSPLQN